jgi:hypothetical protein
MLSVKVISIFVDYAYKNVSKHKIRAEWGIIDTIIFTYSVGLSDYDATIDEINCSKKNNKAITTPILDLVKKV